MSRVGHGLSRVCHGSKSQNQSMVTRGVTASRLQTPMCHPLSHQSTVKADLSRRSQAEANRRRKSGKGGLAAPKQRVGGSTNFQRLANALTFFWGVRHPSRLRRADSSRHGEATAEVRRRRLPTISKPETHAARNFAKYR